MQTISTQELCNRLNLSESTVYGLVKRRNINPLNPYDHKKHWEFPRDILEPIVADMLERRTIESKPLTCNRRNPEEYITDTTGYITSHDVRDALQCDQTMASKILSQINAPYKINSKNLRYYKAEDIYNHPLYIETKSRKKYAKRKKNQ